MISNTVYNNLRPYHVPNTWKKTPTNYQCIKKEKTHSLLIYLSISLSAMDTEGLCKADIAASAFLQQKSVLFE